MAMEEKDIEGSQRLEADSNPSETSLTAQSGLALLSLASTMWCLQWSVTTVSCFPFSISLKGELNYDCALFREGIFFY